MSQDYPGRTEERRNDEDEIQDEEIGGLSALAVGKESAKKTNSPPSDKEEVESKEEAHDAEERSQEVTLDDSHEFAVQNIQGEFASQDDDDDEALTESRYAEF